MKVLFLLQILGLTIFQIFKLILKKVKKDREEDMG